MFDRQPTEPPVNSTPHATSTIDELTVALTNYSRLPSPEYLATCCCAKENCENVKSWNTFRSALENRLILSAEVGQALLQKHDSYVHQHEDCHKLGASTSSFLDSAPEIEELRREKAALEKHLNQALVNAEVAELSTKTAQHELEEARGTISRLTAQNARSLGWDSRLSVAMKERDDLYQERNSEAQRARMAETRIAALRQRMAKLQREVKQLQHDLELRRTYRLESSKVLLQEARTRIVSLQESLGQTAMVEHAELMKVLGELIDDNDSLKRDNAELQSLLASAREDMQHMQEELDEQRANQVFSSDGVFHGIPPQSSAMLPPSERELLVRQKRPSSMEERSRRPFQLPTPEAPLRPLSPTDSFMSSETRSLSQPRPRYPSSQLSFDLNGDDTLIHKDFPTRDCAIQTESWNGLLIPSPYLASPSPNDVRSESSSVSESQGGHISLLVERVTSLLARMAQADAPTLTSRLKRQHLRGADIGHLSQSTVTNIVNDTANLRFQFRTLLEDEKATTICTRKDLRGLFKLFKDVFTEMGAMRVTLNDVILDPSVAAKVSELALNPTKVVDGETGKFPLGSQNPSLGGWIAPLSKLFGATSPLAGSEPTAFGRTTSLLPRGGSSRPAPKIIPKLRPALSASNTTVNVEFSGSGMGRSLTTTFSAHGTIKAEPSRALDNASQQSSSSAMDIFVGAPRVNADPWVMIPTAPKRASTLNPDATIGRRFGKLGISRFSREVDAVIDIPSTSSTHIADRADVDISEEERADVVPPLVGRTLRRRGLSDSSIHSTFSSHQEDPGSPTKHTINTSLPQQPSSSVFSALSRTVQSFRIPSIGSGVIPMDPDTSSTVNASPTFTSPQTPPARPVIPSAWQTASDPFEVGSLRDEDSLLRRHLRS